jgi:hypothetical protein
VLQRVAAAESAIQSGQLQATLTNRDGSSSSADLLFNLGEQQSISSFHITTMYTTTSGVTTLEQIVIKDTAWERRDGGPWNRVPVQEGAWGQIRAFMPQAGSVIAPAANEGVTELRWYDADRDSDCLLLVDPASGVPKELRRVARSSGATLVVTYGGWNTTVDIRAPATP